MIAAAMPEGLIIKLITGGLCDVVITLGHIMIHNHTVPCRDAMHCVSTMIMRLYKVTILHITPNTIIY